MTVIELRPQKTLVNRPDVVTQLERLRESRTWARQMWLDELKAGQLLLSAQNAADECLRDVQALTVAIEVLQLGYET